MRITVLTVPDCPNGPVVEERITAALGGRPAEVERVEVRKEADAVRWGMTGSPTVLIDGVDPFATAGAVPSMSCRVYRDGGRVEGAPGVAALRGAMAEDGCCEPDLLDPVGRGGRGRVAPAGRGLRAVHQAVLRHFAATGRAPGREALEPVAAAAGRTAGEVLAELAREDFLTLDGGGEIRAAYPFSAVRTRHRVRIDGAAEVWSMCAVDALGIPAMLGRDAVISSTDPVTGEPVTVTSTDGKTVWEPESAVVFIGRRGRPGPAETVCCDALNFFTGPVSATTWSRRHPEVPGGIVAPARAGELARRTFGPLLTAPAREDGPMRIRIEATSLPGRTCGAGPDFPGYSGVHVAVQRRDRRDELLGLHPGDAASATWTLECTATPTATGHDLRGPYIQGRPAGRFIYLTWGTVDAPGTFTMFRRAKLMLDAVPPATTTAALRTGTLLARLPLTDRCGRPLCGAVRPPLIEWSAVSAD